MDTLTTKELSAYKTELQNIMDSSPTIDGASVLSALESFDMTKRHYRLLHTIKNFIKQRTPQPGNSTGIVSVTITNAGTGYNVNDVITVDSASGSGAVLRVDGVDLSSGVSAVLIESPGSLYADGDVISSSAGDGTFAGTITIGAIEADERAIIEYLLSNI